MTDYLTNTSELGMTGFGGSDESPRVSYTLRVNGLERPVDEAWIGESLLYVLRERLGLAGAKGGCDQGECGACSVQLDGQLTAACLVPAALAADSEIRTVEGLAADGTGSDVQRALAESGAVQCGYCVPGLAMAVHDLLERNHQPSELQAREALCGNLCRCTGYRGALAAVQAVARSRAEAAATEPEAPVATAAAVQAPVQAQILVQAPVEPEPTVYVELPAQQTAEPEPQYQAYQQQSEAYPVGDYQTGEYATGQFPIPGYGTGDYGYVENGYPSTDYPVDAFPLPGTPIPAQGAPAEAGVYLLPHQQQQTYQDQPQHQPQQHSPQHSPATEAGA